MRRRANRQASGGMPALRLRTEDIYGSVVPSRQKDDVTLLAASIARHGLLQPVVVRWNAQAGRYALVFGTRRLQACRLLGMKEIDALLFEGDEREAAACFLEEHWCREMVSCIEEARAAQKAGGTALLEQFALPRGMLLRRLRLLGLGERVRALVRGEGMTLEQAEALLLIPREDRQLEAASIIASRALNGPQAMRLVTGGAAEEGEAPAGKRHAIREALGEFSAIARRLTAYGIDARVSMHSQGRGICVQILLQTEENAQNGQEKKSVSRIVEEES